MKSSLCEGTALLMTILVILGIAAVNVAWIGALIWAIYKLVTWLTSGGV